VRLGVENTDSDLESTADDSQRVKPHLLVPHASSLAVDEISDKAACGTGGDVQETEHCCPSPSTSLAELREIVEVVGTEDRIDSELGTEGAEVAEGDDGGLWGEDHGHCFLERGLDNDLSTGGIEHLLLRHAGFVVEVAMLGLCDLGFFVDALLVCGG